MGLPRKRSRRPSLTHGRRDHVFFTDRSIDSDTFCQPIIAAGFRLERFHTHIARPDAPDGEWIRRCAEHGWIGLCGDKKITAKPDEMADVMTSGAAVFVLNVGKRTNHPMMAELFLRTASGIIWFWEHRPHPFIAKVTRPNQPEWDRGQSGSVRMWRTYEEWLANRHRRRLR